MRRWTRSPGHHYRGRLLAYLFWHSPQPGFPLDRYESALVRFHNALADSPPAGFERSAAFRVETGNWAGEYEDWYLVEGWEALGELNTGAVTDPRRRPHDAAAQGVAWGAGGVYALLRGEPDPAASRIATWVQKPREETYEVFRDRLSSVDGAVWQRQLVLGPGHEFCVLSDDPTDGLAGAATSPRVPVFPA